MGISLRWVGDRLYAIFRWQADHIERWIDAGRLRILSIIMLDLSIAFFFYAPFSGEKQGVYQMSFLALLFAAIIAVVEAHREKREEDDNSGP